MESPFQVGVRVKAFYNQGEYMYPGTIRTVHVDGTCDIEYDDGDKETLVQPEYMELLPSEIPAGPVGADETGDSTAQVEGNYIFNLVGQCC